MQTSQGREDVAEERPVSRRGGKAAGHHDGHALPLVSRGPSGKFRTGPKFVADGSKERSRLKMSLCERRAREKRPSRGRSAAGPGDESFERLALPLQRLALPLQRLALVFQRLALRVQASDQGLQRGHVFSVSPDAFLLLSLHEFRLELAAAVIGLHHAGDPIEDNADLSSAYEDLGNERCDFKVDHFSVSR